MKSSLTILVVFVATAIILTSFSNVEGVKPVFPEVAYPEGYRDWTHVKTYVVGPKSPAFKFIPGFNHVYGNEKAMEGYRTGYFPNGSVIVSDVVEAKVDSMNTREGKRHHIDVMVRDSLKYADIGGWGFEQFSDERERRRLLTQEVRTTCTNCHVKQKDFVHSEYRE